MKLVIFGLTISSSWGNGHATLWRGLCRALARSGHRIVFFERDVPYYAMNRDLKELPGTDLHLYPDWESALPAARREVADAASSWIWGAFRMPGHVLHDLHALWRERDGKDVYVGTLVNEWLARGGEAWGVCAGEAYVDVGTLHGYREAIQLLERREVLV